MQFFFDEEKKNSSGLVFAIARCCAGLVYISETDAPVTVFTAGPVEELEDETVRAITNSPTDEQVSEIEVETFFGRLTKNEPWHNDMLREQTKKFLELKRLLEEHLHNLKVYKIGRVRLTIYVIGLDPYNNVVGITTRSVET